MKIFLKFIGLISLSLITFFITLYLLILAYFILLWPPGPDEALKNGRLYVRATIHSKDDTKMILEKKTCNVDDCYFIINKEVLVKRSTLDEPFKTGETVILNLFKKEELPEYHKSELEPGLLNKRIFVAQSIESDRFDPFRTDKRDLIGLAMMVIAGGVSLFTGYFFYSSPKKLKAKVFQFLLILIIPFLLFSIVRLLAVYFLV